MKECTKCGESKELTGFGKKVKSLDGLQPQCRSCIKEYNKNHTIRNFTARRDFLLRKTYGITLAERDVMSESQGHRCMICDVEEKYVTNQRLCVDHDHDTGAVRALLCSKCNAAIGLLQDSSAFAHKATLYLKKYDR